MNNLGDYINYIQTANGITVCFSNRPVQVRKDNPLFNELLKKIRNGDKNEIASAVSYAEAVKSFSDNRIFMNNETGQLFVVGYEDTPLPDTLAKTMMAFMENKHPVDPFLKFWENLMNNPSQRSRDCLYGFLEHNHVPLTDDGCFLAYKKVTSNYLDIHSRTFDNTPGKTVTMDRRKVNDNPEQTCSNGLHVAAFSYMAHFGNGSGDKIVTVKVNPADVVAVPIDYNNAKMRVCAYTVLEDITDNASEIPDYLRDSQGQEIEDDDFMVDGGGDSYESSGTELTAELYTGNSGSLRIPTRLLDFANIADDVTVFTFDNRIVIVHRYGDLSENDYGFIDEVDFSTLADGSLVIDGRTMAEAFGQLDPMTVINARVSDDQIELYN